jgi:peptide/nickel transport system permease protein
LPSGNPHKTEEQAQLVMEKIIDRFGLDDPFPIQYAKWLRGLFQGEWGFSPTWRQPVLEGLRQRAPATLELMLFALIPSIILALTLGGLAARYSNRFPDYLVRAAAFIGWAFPSFILGLILMNILYAWLHWFPPERLSLWADLLVESDSFRTYTGMYTIDALLNGNWELFWDAVRHLVLPGLTLAVVEWALLARVMRASLLEALRQDYVITARAKGVKERNVVNLHARRNAILPVISTAGVAASVFISTTVVVEVLFSFNGAGRWALKAVLQSDIPVAVGFALFTCALTVLMSLAADLFYALADPRVRLY